MIRICLILIIATCCQFIFAQNSKYTTRKTAPPKALKCYDKGRQYGQEGEYDKALKQYDKALSIDDTFVDAYIQKGYIFYDKGNYPQAENLLHQVTTMAPDYKARNFYYLAMTQLRQRKLEDAAKNFEYYLHLDDKSKQLKEKAAKHLANCKFSMKAIRNPVDFKPTKLDKTINTEHSEYLPCFTADGETLIFTRLSTDEDFYMSKKGPNGWEESTPIVAINTPHNEGAQSISADGKLMIFTACNREDGLGSCDLYFSEVKNGSWSKPTNMGAPVNSRGWESQPSLSADGKTLYFAKNINPREKNIDIYVSQRQTDGSWGQPQNLGKPINTKDKDESPFIHPDGQTLYFMSKGHPGLGGHDLFLSRKQADQSWGEPINLGYPINTEGSEGALVVSLDGKTAYFASDRGTKSVGTDASVFDTGKPIGHTDIYTFTLTEAARPQPVTFVKARVFDAETKEPLSAEVEFLELNNGKKFASKQTDSDGEFLICLPIGQNYSLNVSKPEYLFHSEHFALAENLTTDESFLLEIGLKRIATAVVAAPESTKEAVPYKEGVAIVLKNVFFDTGSAELRSESYPELLHLKDLLEKHPTLRIRINGHTDNVGNDADNMRLSQNRAKAVYDFLITKGIVANRLAYQGFGETYPVADNATADGRQENRRTEFVVLGK